MSIFKKKADEKESGEKKQASDDKKTVKKEENKKQSMKDLYSQTSPKKDSEVKEIKSSGNAYKILLKPLITEKATVQGAMSKYSFEVAMSSNKIEVARAVENVYGVKPSAVNMVRMNGKAVRYGRISGKRKDWKKAVVTLPKGKTIDVYEGV